MHKRKEERMKSEVLPPLLSLSAGFTWIGLFICAAREGWTRKERKDRVGRRGKESERERE